MYLTDVLPKSKVDKIRFECRASIEEEMKGNRKKVTEKRQQLAENEEKLFTVEEKWIKNEINKDTYDRWYSTYSGTIIGLKGAIEHLNKIKAWLTLFLKRSWNILQICVPFT